MRELYTLAYAGTSREHQLYDFGDVSQMRIDPGACSAGKIKLKGRFIHEWHGIYLADLIKRRKGIDKPSIVTQHYR